MKLMLESTRNIIIIGFSIMSMVISSCEKPEGEGGDATIRGSVWVEDWDSNFNLLKFEFAGADEEVYIIYGDDISYGDKVNTNYLGQYEFKYLREGKYKIYVYSEKKQTVDSPSDIESVIAEVEITSRKQTVIVDTLTIKK
jgi:hypothetical protein